MGDLRRQDRELLARVPVGSDSDVAETRHVLRSRRVKVTVGSETVLPDRSSLDWVYLRNQQQYQKNSRQVSTALARSVSPHRDPQALLYKPGVAKPDAEYSEVFQDPHAGAGRAQFYHAQAFEVPQEIKKVSAHGRVHDRAVTTPPVDLNVARRPPVSKPYVPARQVDDPLYHQREVERLIAGDEDLIRAHKKAIPARRRRENAQNTVEQLEQVTSATLAEYLESVRTRQQTAAQIRARRQKKHTSSSVSTGPGVGVIGKHITPVNAGSDSGPDVREVTSAKTQASSQADQTKVRDELVLRFADSATLPYGPHGQSRAGVGTRRKSRDRDRDRDRDVLSRTGRDVRSTGGVTTGNRNNIIMVQSFLKARSAHSAGPRREARKEGTIKKRRWRPQDANVHVPGWSKRGRGSISGPPPRYKSRSGASQSARAWTRVEVVPKMSTAIVDARSVLGDDQQIPTEGSSRNNNTGYSVQTTGRSVQIPVSPNNPNPAASFRNNSIVSNGSRSARVVQFRKS